MSSPVKVISAVQNRRSAKSRVKKLGLKGAPVVKKKKSFGRLTGTDIRKAMKNRYCHASVKGYMSIEVVTLKSDTLLHVIQRTMFEKAVGRLPVFKGTRLAGIVTRTDVLKSVHRDIFRKHGTLRKKQMRFNISSKMKRILPKEILKMLHVIGLDANRRRYRAFVVGGFVRDMLLGKKNFDIDIVVEGDAIRFGKGIADLFRGSLVAYPKFGTSTVVMDWPKGVRRPEGAGARFKIDFATARKESYEKPAALPTVLFSSLKDDLQRRDFTINAMAASLNKESFGQLIDFFGGEKDLEKGVIRVLHDVSFIDDPTRIFRAVRFEQRFGFHIDRYTEGHIKNAIREGMFSRTQHHRIRDELILMLKEEEPIKPILRMKELHEMRFIHRKILVRKSTEILFAKIKGAFRWYRRSAFKKRHIDLWLIYLLGLLERLSLAETKAVCEKFAFRRGDRMRIISSRKNCRKALKALSRKLLRPSEVYNILEPLSFEETLFIRAKAKKKAALLRITDFFTAHNKTKIKISGKDIMRLGVKPGPLYRKLLAKVLHKKLDGGLKTKKDELEYVKKLIH